MTGISAEHLRAWRAVLSVQSAVVARVETALAEAGLPPLAWYDVLWALRSAPRGRLRMGALAGHVTISRGGLTKLVDRLEGDGLLVREACPTDRRGFDAVLTAKGRAVLRQIWPVYERVLVESLAPLTESEAAATAATLERLLET
ncbi:MAG: MarR family transcriptional regulator [Gaiellaceae bacterium]